MAAILQDVGLIVAAGGTSSRFGGAVNKLLLTWRDRPVFAHCIANFLPLLEPANIVLVLPSSLIPEFTEAMRACRFPAAIRVVPGGAARQDSVMCGLAAMPPDAAFVAVQDAARPCTPPDLLARCVTAARSHGAAVAAHRIVDTLKRADAKGLVCETVARDGLWAAETPQVFDRAWLLEAYRQVRARGLAVTDDAQAVELLGHAAVLIENRQPNPKITVPEDLLTLNARGGIRARSW